MGIIQLAYLFELRNGGLTSISLTHLSTNVTKWHNTTVIKTYCIFRKHPLKKKFDIKLLKCGATHCSTVVSIHRAVHATLSILHKILRTGETCSQAYKAYDENKLQMDGRSDIVFGSELRIYQRKEIYKKGSPSSYALAATLAAIWAEIFLMLENGG